MTKLINKASKIEDGLVDDLLKLIEKNQRLFDGEKVVLMADAHKGKDIPVGFTMTLSKGLVPPTFVSADIGCGMSSVLIKDLVLSRKQLMAFKQIARDIIKVNRTFTRPPLYGLTTEGTLGNGNHFVEIGTNGTDTLITVHSGSRAVGAATFEAHLKAANEQAKHRIRKVSKAALEEIEPRYRSQYLKDMKAFIQEETVPYLDLSLYGYEKYQEELEDAIDFASQNRSIILANVLSALFGLYQNYDVIETIHNYIEFKRDGTMILRKGSINAEPGKQVIIPINMRDGIILGISNNTEDVNFSLPHGAGRVMSRTAAFKNLDLETFKEDMKDIVSPTVNENTLDESPRAYKDIETILKDITPYLKSYEIFKPQFNFKGE